jgi:ATP-dependent DNA ligase
MKKGCNDMLSSEINIRLRRLKSIKGKGSVNKKIELLQEYMKDDIFLKFIQYTLDSRKHYNIKQLPLLDEFNFKNMQESEKALENILIFLNELSLNRGCSDHEKNKLVNMITSRDLYDVVSTILSKSLNCGCSITTVNKARPNTVEDFPYMRCSTIAKISNIKYPAIVQEKMNGEYIAIIIKNKKVVHRTRDGSFLDLKGYFSSDFSAIKSDTVLMGEILATDPKTGEYLSRTESNGIMLKAQTGSITEDQVKSINIVLWDCVSYDTFMNTSTAEPVKYVNRLYELNSIIKNINNPAIKVVNGIKVSDYDQVVNYYNKIVAENKEGVVLKDLTNVFKNGTAVDLIKIKPVRDADMKIVSWEYGDVDKKYRHCMGSITIESKDGSISCSCGSGFKDSERGYLGTDDNGNLIVGMDQDALTFWNNSIGKIVEVHFAEVMEKDDDNGQMSLYNCVFKRFRSDKSVADTTNRICNQ